MVYYEYHSTSCHPSIPTAGMIWSCGPHASKPFQNADQRILARHMPQAEVLSPAYAQHTELELYMDGCRVLRNILKRQRLRHASYANAADEGPRKAELTPAQSRRTLML